MKRGLEMHAAEVAEEGQLLALAIAFYDEDGFACDPDAMRANLRVLRSSPEAHVAVVTDGPRVLAFAITTTSFGLENGLIAELEDLYVAPERRRQGIAEALITDSACWARDRGCGQLELVVAPDGLDASHLMTYYQARGFTDAGRRLLARQL